MRNRIFGFLNLPDDFGAAHLDDAKTVLLAVVLGAIVLGLMIWGGVSAVRVLILHKSQSEDFSENAPEAFSEDFESELPPLTELHAVVTAKDAQIVHTGSSKMPSHHIQCRILFTLDNNEVCILNVPQEAFERIFKNQIGTLVLQEDEFFDFSVD